MQDEPKTAREATDSAEAIAQSRTGGPPNPPGTAPAQPGEGDLYAVSERLDLAHTTQPYERRGGDPLYRRLPIFALDASASAEEGRVTTLKLPYEPVAPGPVGSILKVDATVEGGPEVLPAELDHPHVLLAGGYRPSITDPRFHKQMVYAVAMQTYGQFQTALGRQPSWGFDRRGADGRNRLVLRPFGAPEMQQAWYDRDAGEVVFGYFQPRFSTPTVPARDGSNVFLSLSHDIVVHEVTHALLDGLRPEFFVASHPDVPAFHEAFADLVAVFQRFAHENVVTAALRSAGGDLGKAQTLSSIGAEFGRATSSEQEPLRSLYEDLGRLGEPGGQPPPYARAPDEPHERGRYLARAVFRAFMRVYERRARRYVKLATGGTGVLPAGEISSELTQFLVEEIRRIALQFATICIRAIDYCPPVDVRFGDYLRALVTADLDLVPDDDWAYRTSIIESFGVEGIYGEGTAFMTEEALSWQPPRVTVPAVPALGFGETRFDGDPARPANAAELRKQAGAIGRLVADPRLAREFGLVSPGTAAFETGEFWRPVVMSVRSARRVGPDMQVTFDTVAEVVQRRMVTVDGLSFPVFGGSTVIVGPRGEVRYVIRKRVDHEARMREQAEYLKRGGLRFWDSDGTTLAPRPDGLRLMCAR